jgi:hypothetical protein
MSVSHTADAVIARRKTVTRRLGWLFLRPGDHLTLCRKVMGRKPGEPLDRLAEVEIVYVWREPLTDMKATDIAKEAVPAEAFIPGWWDRGLPVVRPSYPEPEVMTDAMVDAWVTWFAKTMGCKPDDEVTRIEWRYLTDAELANA